LVVNLEFKDLFQRAFELNQSAKFEIESIYHNSECEKRTRCSNFDKKDRGFFQALAKKPPKKANGIKLSGTFKITVQGHLDYP